MDNPVERHTIFITIDVWEPMKKKALEEVNFFTQKFMDGSVVPHAAVISVESSLK